MLHIDLSFFIQFVAKAKMFFLFFLFIGYTELGDIELSKIRTDYADCFSGRHIYCHDYIYGSGQFVCLQKGSIYMKNLQGVNFAMDGVDGNVETESVYCSDVVFTNEQGHVSTGVVQTSTYSVYN